MESVGTSCTGNLPHPRYYAKHPTYTFQFDLHNKPIR